jgi:peptidoglycan/LPS O-acetylase OafA/YrhL
MDQQIDVRRLGYLDGLRAIAATYVLIYHVLLKINLANYPPVVFLMVQPLAYGHYAVDMFIVISGFCLMLPVIKNNGSMPGGYLLFFKKRARRILPTYYLALIFTLLLIFTIIGKKTNTIWDGCIPVTLENIWTHLLLVQDMFYHSCYAINYTFWSISVEWHIYFLFPLLLLVYKKWGLVFTMNASFVLSIFLWYALSQTPLSFYTMSPHYIGLFVFGMFAAQLSFGETDFRLKRNFWHISNLILSGIFGLTLLCIVIFKIIVASLFQDLLFGILAALFLVFLSKGKLKYINRLLSWRPLVFVGSFAYSIYLIHAPLLQVITQYLIAPLHLNPTNSLLALLVLGVPLIIALAYLFFLVAERPFLRYRKNARQIELVNVNVKGMIN